MYRVIDDLGQSEDWYDENAGILIWDDSETGGGIYCIKRPELKVLCHFIDIRGVSYSDGQFVFSSYLLRPDSGVPHTAEECSECYSLLTRSPSEALIDLAEIRGGLSQQDFEKEGFIFYGKTPLKKYSSLFNTKYTMALGRRCIVGGKGILYWVESPGAGKSITLSGIRRLEFTALKNLRSVTLVFDSCFEWLHPNCILWNHNLTLDISRVRNKESVKAQIKKMEQQWDDQINVIY